MLHYLNETAFFFVLTMCVTFTDFVEDIPTRMKTASMLSTFMFVILALNVLICVVAIILSVRPCCKSKEKQETKKEAEPETILRRKRTIVQDDSSRALNESASERHHDVSVDAFILPRACVLQIGEEENDGTNLRAIPAGLRLDSRTNR